MNLPLVFSIFIAFYVYIYLFLQLTETSSQILYRPNEVPVLQWAYFRTRLHVLSATFSRRIWLRWIRIAYEFLFSYILHISRYEHSLIMTVGRSVCYKLDGIRCFVIQHYRCQVTPYKYLLETFDLCCITSDTDVYQYV